METTKTFERLEGASQEAEGVRDAWAGIPGYGQAPPGVRTTKPELTDPLTWPEPATPSGERGPSASALEGQPVTEEDDDEVYV
jgi:hypothetical protein